MYIVEQLSVSNFVLKNKAVRDIWMFKVWYLPLKRLVTLTTVLRYRAACDNNNNNNFKHLNYTMSGSLRFTIHNFDKFKYIFIIFGKNHSDASFY